MGAPVISPAWYCKFWCLGTVKFWEVAKTLKLQRIQENIELEDTHTRISQIRVPLLLQLIFTMIEKCFQVWVTLSLQNVASILASLESNTKYRNSIGFATQELVYHYQASHCNTKTVWDRKMGKFTSHIPSIGCIYSSVPPHLYQGVSYTYCHRSRSIKANTSRVLLHTQTQMFREVHRPSLFIQWVASSSPLGDH